MRVLENKATFYIPVDKDGGQVAQEVAQQAAEQFGGSTLVPASGLWHLLSGKFEQESINLVHVWVRQAERVDFANFITKTVKYIGLTLEQEAVAVEINNHLGIYSMEDNYE